MESVAVRMKTSVTMPVSTCSSESVSKTTSTCSIRPRTKATSLRGRLDPLAVTERRRLAAREDAPLDHADARQQMDAGQREQALWRQATDTVEKA